MFVIDFQDKFRTLPEHQQDLKKAYNHKGSRWLTERFYKLRKGTGKQDWIELETVGLLVQFLVFMLSHQHPTAAGLTLCALNSRGT